MPAPSFTIADAGGNPGVLPNAVTSGGSGGGAGGLVSQEIRGVCVAFASAALEENPLWTRLDDPTGPFIVSEWSIDRGRTYELDKTGVGTASVKLIDLDGTFDPTNTGGPFFGDLNPMKQAAIALHNPVTDTWHTVFRGFVKRWSYDMYQTEDYCTVTLELVDGMEVLAEIEMFPQTHGDPELAANVLQIYQGNVVFWEDELPKHRIDQVLDQCGWPANLREIFTGNVPLKRTSYSRRTQALTAILDSADAEFPGLANFYFQKDGKATFHGRYARFNPTDANYHISEWDCADMSNINSDRALIFELQYDRDAEKIINSCTAYPQDISDADIDSQTVEDTASIAAYGTKSISFDNLLTDGDHIDGSDANDATLKFAEFYVNNYAQPLTRVNTVTFKRLPPNSTYAARVWRVICGVDISDVVIIRTTHPGTGFSGFLDPFFVEGVHMTAKPLSDTYLDVEVTLDLSPGDHYLSNPFE